MSETCQPEVLLEQALSLMNDRYEENSNFNEFFDADGLVQVGQSAYPPSKVLFWVDPNAYGAERVSWENNANEEKHEKAVEILRENNCIGQFEDLLQAVERGRVVPFVGAGFSKPLGMPLWGEALVQLLGRLPGADAPAITALIAGGAYLEAAQALAAHDQVQTSHFIRTTYRAQKLKLAGPLLKLPKFAKGCIVTTNFDDAIEKTYEGDKIEFKAYMHGTQEHNFFQRLVRGDRCLLKLHGDAENDATHILTKNQYEEAYGEPFDFQKPLPKALRQIYISQSLFFLGCSLDQDWTMELFKTAKEGDGYQVPTHYALLAAPADAQVKQQKETRLLALNIQPIWYPDGQHELIERILDLIVDVAEKRVVFTG